MATYDPHSLETDPWRALRSNFVYLSQKLRISVELLGHLLESSLVTRDDYQTLKSSRPTYENMDKLLIDILPTRPPTDFPVFCRILRTVGQDHVATVLERSTEPLPETTTPVQVQIDLDEKEQTVRDGLQSGLDEETDSASGTGTPTAVAKLSFRKYNRNDIKVSDFIDAGGYSKVYVAEVIPDSVRVAVKVFNEGSKSRFNKYDLTDLDKEIEILSRLQSHPNVVTLLGYCDDPESYMLVMEYVEGANLDQLIGRRLHRDISQWTQRLDVSSQIAEGLHYIHSQNPPIIHMDLSSHNVLVEINQSSNSGVKFLCKITDFGLSKMKSVSSQSSKYDSTGSRIPSGTALFIAPERYTAAFDVSRRTEDAMKADVFSYGMIMYGVHEMRWPYSTEGDFIVVTSLRFENRPNFGDESDFERKSYRQLLNSCWSQIPRERPQMKEVAEKLRDMLQQQVAIE